MSDQATVDDHRRASQSQLLTKIYYPDTLYPDNYSFFADRSESTTPKGTSSLPMHPNGHYPTTTTTTTESNDSPPSVSTMSKQATAEGEILERQGKYPVSSPSVSFYSLNCNCFMTNDASSLLLYMTRSKKTNLCFRP
jgi:hypothetical protein